MKLTLLKPQFYRYELQPDNWIEQLPDGTRRPVSGLRGLYVRVNGIQDAMGIMYLCPRCFTANDGRVGTHQILNWSKTAGTPDDADPKGRWVLRGTGYDDLTLDAEPGRTRSVLLIGGCAWHGYITNGEVTDA